MSIVATQRDEASEALRRWRGGDTAGFDRLHALVAPGLRAFCRTLTKDESAAADLFQETWAQAIARIRDYREDRSFPAWLGTLAYHLWVDQRRRRETERRLLASRPPPSEEAPGQVGEALALREVLDRLPPEEREAVLLYHLEGLLLREVAALQGVSVASVHERLMRAYQALAKLLKTS